MSMRNPILDHYEREYGIYFSDAVELAKDEWKHDYRIAMDAQPTLITTPNSGIPAFLTTIVDPNLLRVLTAKNNATKILEEVRKGDELLTHLLHGRQIVLPRDLVIMPAAIRKKPLVIDDSV